MHNGIYDIYFYIYVCILVLPTVSSSGQFATLRGRDVSISFTINDAFPDIDVEKTQWYFDDIEITFDSTNYTISNDTLSLTVHNPLILSEGMYDITVANIAGTGEGTTLLKVYGMFTSYGIITSMVLSLPLRILSLPPAPSLSSCIKTSIRKWLSIRQSLGRQCDIQLYSLWPTCSNYHLEKKRSIDHSKPEVSRRGCVG